MIQSNFVLDGSNTDRRFKIACHEQPQERLENYGVAALSDTELVALLLQGNGQSVEAALGTASAMIAEAESVAALAAWTVTDYAKLTGVGRSRAMKLIATVELGRRILNGSTDAKPHLNRVETIVSYFRPFVTGLHVEKFWVACLNRKNRLIKRVEVTSGTATAALAHPREVFRAAIRESATAIVCVHNHPSGDPAPSSADLQVTRQLREAARAVDIDFLDHVIIGSPEADPTNQGWYSFRAAGLL